MIWAKVTTRFEGCHYWKDAPTEVEFLQYPHRHVFHVTVWVEQSHEHRDVEYIKLKWWLDAFIRGPMFQSGAARRATSWSCETMASAILHELEVAYASRRIRVEVLEDGENGALVESPTLP